MNVFDYHKAVFKADLSSNAKLTALAIASHFRWADLNPAFPGNALLSKETGLGISTITKAKKELKDKGYLEVQRRFNGTSLHVPAIPTDAPTEQVAEGALTEHVGFEEHEAGTEELHTSLPQSTRSALTEHTFRSDRASNNEVNKETNKEELKTKTKTAASASASPALPLNSSQEDVVEPLPLISNDESDSPLIEQEPVPGRDDEKKETMKAIPQNLLDKYWADAAPTREELNRFRELTSTGAWGRKSPFDAVMQMLVEREAEEW